MYINIHMHICCGCAFTVQNDVRNATTDTHRVEQKYQFDASVVSVGAAAVDAITTGNAKLEE